MAVILMGISNGVMALDCANAETTIAIVDCRVARYQMADKELNALYSKAMKALTESQQAKLKSAQKAWLTFRDNSFAFIIEINKDTGTLGNVIISDYKATFVEKRVLELKYLLSNPEDAPVEW